jgi:sarcosine oxidase subunit beta
MLGEDVEYIQNGNMRLGKTEEHEKILRKLVTENRAGGLDLKLIYGKDIRELNPYVADDVTVSTWCPTDGHANPMRTTLAFYKRARQLGAQFIIGEPVRALEKHQGKIRRVITETNIYEGEKVLLCAGFPSRKIMRTLGLDIPMLQQYTEAFVTEPVLKMVSPFICCTLGTFYAQQQENGTWVIGGDSDYEIYDAEYDRCVTFSFSAPRIARFFLDYIPALRQTKVIRSWSGMLDMSWDGVATISPVEEVPGLFLACGFTGHGFGIGPASGMVLSQMIMGEKTAVPLESLRYDRFRVPSH